MIFYITSTHITFLSLFINYSTKASFSSRLLSHIIKDGKKRHLFAEARGRILKEGEKEEEKYYLDKLIHRDYQEWKEKVEKLDLEVLDLPGVTDEYRKQYRERFRIAELEEGFVGEKMECFRSIKDYYAQAKVAWTPQTKVKPSYVDGMRGELEELEEEEEEREDEEPEAPMGGEGGGGRSKRRREEKEQEEREE